MRQGLPFRGHLSDEGNFLHLLKLRSEDCPVLSSYLKRTTSYTSPEAQSEMIDAFSHEIIRKIAAEVKRNGPFAVMVDGTQDIGGKEQESICFRHVNDNLEIHEDFVGLYHVTETSGQAISDMIVDVLTRLCLSVDALRAQTYDGAANMSGKYSGCQAKLREKQPLALHIHCGAHVANLVMQQAVTGCPLVHDTVQWVHELGVFLKRSGKQKAIFEAILTGSKAEESISPGSIRPLCPTRWLCRSGPITATLNYYESVIEFLEKSSQTSNKDVAAKARGLLQKFIKGETLFGLMMAIKPITALEQLNKGLQSKTANISGMMTAVALTGAEIRNWRSEEEYAKLFVAADSKAKELELDPLEIPRTRQTPKRFSGPAVQYQAKTPEEHYRKKYYEYLDLVVTGLTSRYDESQAGLTSYQALERILITGDISEEITSQSRASP